MPTRTTPDPSPRISKPYCANGSATRHDYVVLAASRQVVQAVLAAVPEPSPGELNAAGRKVLYWQDLRGESLKSRIAKELAKAAAGD